MNEKIIIRGIVVLICLIVMGGVLLWQRVSEQELKLSDFPEVQVTHPILSQVFPNATFYKVIIEPTLPPRYGIVAVYRGKSTICQKSLTI